MKARLAAGEHVFGTVIQFVRTPAIVRMAAAAGLDFVFIDLEHSSLGIETVANMCEVARACGVTPIVRPYGHDPSLVNRIQDIGATGLMFHDVTTRAQVERLADAMHYPPRGSRGITTGGAPTDYLPSRGAESQALVDAETLLVIQIESRAGVEAIDSILAGGRIDVAEVGRQDLAASLGVPGEIRAPVVMDAVDAVVAACLRHGVTPGVNAVSDDDARDLIARGVRCIGHGTDKGLLAASYRSIAAVLRGAASSRAGP